MTINFNMTLNEIVSFCLMEKKYWIGWSSVKWKDRVLFNRQKEGKSNFIRICHGQLFDAQCHTSISIPSLCLTIFIHFANIFIKFSRKILHIRTLLSHFPDRSIFFILIQLQTEWMNDSMSRHIQFKIANRQLTVTIVDHVCASVCYECRPHQSHHWIFKSFFDTQSNQTNPSLHFSHSTWNPEVASKFI